jgi:hypothetical protein
VARRMILYSIYGRRGERGSRKLGVGMEVHVEDRSLKAAAVVEDIKGEAESEAFDFGDHEEG